MAHKVKFEKRYNHTFKATRAMKNFPAGFEGPVVDEVYEGAKAAGALVGEKATETKGEGKAGDK